MRGASRLLRRLSSVSSTALNGCSDTATRSLSTGTELKNLMAEKIPEQQVWGLRLRVTSARASTIHQLRIEEVTVVPGCCWYRAACGDN